MQLRALKSTSANSRNSRLPRAVLAILAGSIASMAVARSANAAVWTGTTGGTWVTTGKWEGGGVGGSPAPATTDSSIVSFPANTPANTRINVTVDSGRNVGGFSFPASGANFGNYLFVGGQLVFSAGASVSVTGSKSTASFVVPITLLGDASFSTSRSLGIGGGGTITGSAGAGVTNTISVSSSGSGGVHFGAISDGSGGGKLALTSSGSADLTSASSYSGDTTINGGSLSVEQGSAIYSDGDNFLSPNSAIYLNNGTLDLSASSTQTVPSVHLTGTNTIALGLRNGYTQTLNSILSGPGGILISGTSSSAATFVSPGLNTFTGDVNISHGTFSVNALADPATAQPLGQGANPVTLSNTGTLKYTGPGTTWSRGLSSTGGGYNGVANYGTGTLTLGGTLSTDGTSYLTLSGSQPINVTGTIVGSGSASTLQIASALTPVTLSSDTNTYARTFIYNGATLKNGIANALPASSSLTFPDGNNGTYDLNGFDSRIGSLSSVYTSTDSTPIITNGAAGTGTNTLTVGGGTSVGSGVFNGVIRDGATARTAVTIAPGNSGVGTVSFAGLELNGQNTYSGTTTITTGGYLIASTENTLSPNSALVMQDGSNLVLNADQTVPSLTLAGTPNITLNDYKLNVPAISGNGGLALAGGGTLSGANTFTGPVTISGGTVYLDLLADSGTPQPLGQGTAPVQFGTGGALAYTGPAATWNRSITVTDGTGTVANNGTGTLTLGGTLSKDGTVLVLTGSSPINVTGTIIGGSNNSDLVVGGVPATLSSANSYNGPTYIRNGGALTAAVAGALPSNTTLILDDTGTGSSKLILGADQSADSLSLPATSSLLTEQYHLTLTSVLTLAGTAANPDTLEFALAGPNGGELLLSGGTFSGSAESNSVALLINAPTFTSGTYPLIDWTGGTLSDVDLEDFFIDPASNLPLGLSAYTLSINGSELDIAVAPVPEADTAFFGFALTGLCAGLLRKTRRASIARQS